jgi:hypothetical protein
LVEGLSDDRATRQPAQQRVSKQPWVGYEGAGAMNRRAAKIAVEAIVGRVQEERPQGHGGRRTPFAGRK